jgi:carbonic anhydrase
MVFCNPTAVVQKKYTVEPLPSDFIPSLGRPEPQILWVGCSDSWITETASLDVLPEEAFVHRNLGAVLSNGDLSSRSAIDYCVNLLKVRAK